MARKQVPIAIVGVSALFAGSDDAQGFWRDILAGKDLITDVPPSHWLIEDYYDPDPKALDKTYAKRGAFIRPQGFDPMAFGIPPNIVPATDTAQLLALIVAQKVLEDASRSQFKEIDRERMSIILGVTSAQELINTMVSRLQKPVWVKALRESGLPEDQVQQVCERISSNYVPWQEATFPGLLGNVVAGRIANRFDLRGTNTVTDAACASALAAVSMAVNELATGQSDVVITGGVDTMNDIFMYICFSKTPALSPTGDCRPFSDSADGTMLGEGLGMVAMKRLEDAERDGDQIYAVLRGLGSSSDGRGPSVYAPLPAGQARALRRCYESAGYNADTVELVEAHGTGTKAGDAAEFEGLRMAFGEVSDKKQWCALGSVKSQIGHTKAAAGAAGLFKGVMALHHKVLPPTIKVERPNPKLNIDSTAFYLNTEARPWIRNAQHPRRVGVSSFGFGGSNFHLTLEEFVPSAGSKAVQPWRTRSNPTELVVLSADSPATLIARAKEFAVDDAPLADVARKSQLSVDSKLSLRAAIVASDSKDLAQKVAQLCAQIEKQPDQEWSTPTGIHYARRAAATADEVGFVFPGQGSQYVKMGADLAMENAEARGAWDRSANSSFDGIPVHEKVFARPVFTEQDRDAQQVALTQTEWAQPALGVCSVATLRVLESLGIRPSCAAGHSFGELTALHAAGVMDEQTLLAAARKRGELMRDAAATTKGTMTAVSHDARALQALLDEWKSAAVIANHNSPTQVVLSGSVEAIEDVEKRLSAVKIAAKRLSVATAFHSSIVAASSAPFAQWLESNVQPQAPKFAVFGNSDAALYNSDAMVTRQRLAAQLALPVRWVAIVEAMYAKGVRTFVEVGPGSVLTGLVGRILEGRPHRAISTDRKGKHGISSLQDALGQMFVAGVSVDFAPLWTAYAPPATTKRKKPALELQINGSNYGKPYPPPGGAKDLPKPNPARAAVSVAPAAVPASKASAPAASVQSTPVPTVVAQPVTPASVPAAPTSTSALSTRNGVSTSISTGKSTPSTAQTTSSSMTKQSNPEVQLAWVRAYQEAQRQTVEAHAAYQRSMAETQVAFLSMAQSSFQGMAAMMTGQPVLQSAPQPIAQLSAPVAAPTYVAPVPAPIVAPAPVVHVAPAVQVAPAPVAVQAAPALVVAPAPVPVPVAAPAPVPAPSSNAAGPSAAELEKVLLEVVAEKTGYPAEMLGTSMELEADLGIDSIKRVEILSAMRSRVANLPEVKPNELASLRTLGQIVEYMRDKSGGAPAASAAPAAPAVAAASATTAVAAVASSASSAGPSAAELEKVLLEVVAEKTGYPAEMLGMTMELEADLGIDSIKRVEILSAMRSRVANLPEVKPNELASLRTLGQIVEYMRGKSGGASEAASVGSSAATRLQAQKEGHDPPKVDPELKADALRIVNPVGRFRVELSVAPAPGLAIRGLHSASRLRICGENEVALALAARLKAHNPNVFVANHANEIVADDDFLIVLDGLGEVASVDAAIAVNRSVFAKVKTVAASMAARGGALVLVQDTGGDFGRSGSEPIRAWLGGISALGRTCAQEWPKAVVQTLDVARGGRTADALAAAIEQELLTGAGAREVSLFADGTRSTVVCKREALSAGPSVLEAGSVVVATGGARGVTARCLLALAQNVRGIRIALLGRTPLEAEPVWAVKAGREEPALKRACMVDAQSRGEKVTPAQVGATVSRVIANREVAATIAALEAAGAEVLYLATDVQNTAAMKRSFQSIRLQWGTIHGLVHGAGVLADKLIEAKTQEQFDRVFDTKVLALKTLLEVTEQDALRAICLFSSVAARTGNTGQSDYAMANEVLNLVALSEQARRGDACIVRSLGWGPWAGGMVTAELEKHFATMGVSLIGLDSGAKAFVDELANPGAATQVVISGSDDEKSIGEGSLGSSSEQTSVSELRVSAATHPELADHAIAGTVVVPVVGAMEWMVRAAKTIAPAMSLRAVRSIQVMNGIKLDRYTSTGDTFTLSAKKLSNGTGIVAAVELRGAKDRLHYRAQIELGEPLQGVATAVPSVAVEAFAEPVYDGHCLFHGPQFRVIDRVEGVSREGATATMHGLVGRGWHTLGWQTDPALMDGVLQLAVLWSKKVLGGATLPMSIGAVTFAHAGPVSGPVRTIVHGRAVESGRAVSDVFVVDQSHRVLFAFNNVEVILRPGEPTSAVAVSNS